MIIPVAAAIETIVPTGFATSGCFMYRYEITIAGNAIAIKIPARVIVKFDVFNTIAYIPNPNDMDKITKVVALALLLVEIPPSKIPAARKINPTNMVKPVSACIPSMNVCAMPA
jgi:hypothetical protein